MRTAWDVAFFKDKTSLCPSLHRLVSELPFSDLSPHCESASQKAATSWASIHRIECLTSHLKYNPGSLFLLLKEKKRRNLEGSNISLFTPVFSSSALHALCVWCSFKFSGAWAHGNNAGEAGWCSGYILWTQVYLLLPEGPWVISTLGLATQYTATLPILSMLSMWSDAQQNNNDDDICFSCSQEQQLRESQ